jgi:hypothetical protein
MNSRQFFTLFTPFQVFVDTSNYIIQARAGMHTTRVFVLATNWPSLQDSAGSTTLSMRDEIQETGLGRWGKSFLEKRSGGRPRLAQEDANQHKDLP